MVNAHELITRYEQTFAGARPTQLIRAPGRVNLIGEHTDYNNGLVLPVAMSQALYVTAGPVDGQTIHVRSTAFDEMLKLPVDDPAAVATPKWGNYVRGVAALLRQQGVELRPANVLIHSEVPLGGGVSSSAALEVGVAKALLAMAGLSLEPIPLAMLARQAEHEYAGSPCGIMDQFICVLGEVGHALLLDCKSQEYQHIPFAPADSVLMIMDTQVKHDLGTSEYPLRQQQCAEAVGELHRVDARVKSLRDVKLDVLHDHEANMSPIAYRRARHVVSEIARTLQAGAALTQGDLKTFGELMRASHDSLRDDYEVSCKELDALVDTASQIPGVWGARMTGGGFGGCAIALVKRDAVGALHEAVQREYNSRFEHPAVVYETSAADGAGQIPLPT